MYSTCFSVRINVYFNVSQVSQNCKICKFFSVLYKRMNFLRHTILRKVHNMNRMPQQKTFTVAVEGNIGSGKTTFLNYFEKNEEVAVLSEPIDFWRNCQGYNLLDLLYQDPKKWCFTFQSYVQLTMLNQHQIPVNQPVKLMERSIYSARYCFVEKMARDGLMSPPSVAVIDQWFKYLTSKPRAHVDLFVYLRTSPEIAYERILKRNRSEEKSVSFDYVKALHEIHEEWLFHKTLHSTPAPVILMNADLDKTDITEEYKKYGRKILNLC